MSLITEAPLNKTRPSVESTPAPAPASQWKLALADIISGVQKAPIWAMIGWYDIKQRYRRSIIGPFWFTLSTGIMVVALGFLYAGLFKTDIKTYLPFLAVGLIVWGFIAGVINEGCQAFIASEQMIKQIKLPLSVHAYRVIWRNLIIFGHNLLIYVLVLIYFAIDPGWKILLALPGMALVLINATWVTLLFGLLCARFRDIPQIITNLVQVVFFVTPIMWQPSLLKGRPALIRWNPFHHLVDVVRAPLLGEWPASMSWWFLIVMAALGWLITLFMFRKYRARIPYWL
jgi:ABC-type polysaccharide/polyol phosphate export permease